MLGGIVFAADSDFHCELLASKGLDVASDDSRARRIGRLLTHKFGSGEVAGQNGHLEVLRFDHCVVPGARGSCSQLQDQ